MNEQNYLNDALSECIKEMRNNMNSLRESTNGYEEEMYENIASFLRNSKEFYNKNFQVMFLLIVAGIDSKRQDEKDLMNAMNDLFSALLKVTFQAKKCQKKEQERIKEYFSKNSKLMSDPVFVNEAARYGVKE